MKKLALFLSVLSTCFLSACQPFDVGFANSSNNPHASFQSAPVNKTEDPGIIGPSRQITHVGPRSGEGYFSPDGQMMIFQSERSSDNPFYQIFSLNLKTGESVLLSTGSGKTTCAWFHPTMKKYLFSSTHQDPNFQSKVQEELKGRATQQKAKYSWSYDETYDIYEGLTSSTKLKNLTKTLGYDAEGSYSPNGEWIAFASNRTGYESKLSPDDEKLFKQDPSSQMEIYIMKSDGTQVKRLTDHLGYDGGPFFSADGKKITWRRFTPNGSMAEIWSMNIDGSEQKQLTQLKAMSWAPYFHPSGDYIVFTTNKLGYSNFELFIVDAKGAQEPVRVSYIDGFDGLPVFSPDGGYLSWTHRDEKGESQIYLAPWDDNKARGLLGLEAKAPKSNELLGGFNQNDFKKWVNYLSSNDLGGRLTGSKEEKQMADSVALYFKSLGLSPEDGAQFVQNFDFASGIELGTKNELLIKTDKDSKKYELAQDFLPVSFSKTGKFGQGDVAFGGYGLVAPATEKEPAYSSYRDLDVAGKWVLVFRDIPEDIPNTRRIFLNQVSRLHHKALAAKQAGAIGLLIASGPTSTSGTKIPGLRFDGSFAEAGIPVVNISNEVAETLVKNSGKTLKSWQELNDKGEIHGLSKLDGIRVQVSVDLIEKRATGHNTLGVLKVKGAKETILLGAHGDHLGRGEIGSSLAKGSESGKIHPGADDNASGVAALLLIAKELSKEVQAGRLKLDKNIAFAVWSGEEIGLLGSSAYVKKIKTLPSIYLNMDMIGRLKDSLMIQGVGSAKEWAPVLERLGISQNLPISLQQDPYLPTDSMSFYLKQVPTITFFTGAHGEYHSPRDLPETLNYEGLSRIAKAMKGLILELAFKKTDPYQIDLSKNRELKKTTRGP
jgi:Tol biopolymer transport system component